MTLSNTKAPNNQSGTVRPNIPSSFAGSSPSLNSEGLNCVKLFGESAFNALPAIIQLQLMQCKRVVLIANNPSIKSQTLDALLAPHDLLVLFNHFIHANYFAESTLARYLPKLLFFRRIGDSPIHFGLPPRPNNVTRIEQMIKSAPTGFLFSNIDYQFPDVQDDPSFGDPAMIDASSPPLPESMTAQFLDSKFSRTIKDNHGVVSDYPHFEDIHSSAPSSGFFIYRLMLAIRDYLLSQHQQELEIVMIGFNHDSRTEYFWHGHNWAFERAEMTTPPTGVSIIQQY